MKLKVLIAILFAAISLNAQEAEQDSVKPAWVNKFHLGSQFTQAYFDNWAQGGQKTWAAGFFFNANMNYDKDGHKWTNQLQTSLGFVNTPQLGTQKNEDRIELNSKYGRKIYNNIDLAALLDFKTQFIEGYNLPDDSTVVSKFLAPAWLNISVGLDWSPDESFSVYYSPLSGRIIIVNDQGLADEGAFGADVGATITPDLGSYLVLAYNDDLGDVTGAKLLKNVTVDSRLELFMNYTPPNPEDIKNVDVNWKNQLSMKVNEYISLNFMLHLIYDDDVLLARERVNDQGEVEEFKELAGLQIMQTLGVGLSIKF